MSSTNRFFVFDVMAMIFRSYYALGRSQLSRSDGLATGAIYGSCVFINKVLSEEKPEYVAFVSDTPDKTFRHDLYDQYKANRDAPPDDLVEQIPHVFDFIKALGFECFTAPGYEADDLIGSLVSKFAGSDLNCYIVSGDKDFYQLVNRHTFLYSPKKYDVIDLVDEKRVEEKFGCTPELVIDALAMIGDTADNVPGVKGIGEKGAAKLLSQYGSLDGIYENLDHIRAKSQKTNLERDRELAYLSKRLVTIRLDLEVENDINFYSLNKGLARPEVRKFYEEYGFRSLAKKWSSNSEDDDRSHNQNPRESEKKNYIKLDQFIDFISSIDTNFPVYCWFELQGDLIPDIRFFACQLSHKNSMVHVSFHEDLQERSSYLLTLSSLLGDSRINKVSYGFKRVYHACRNENLTLTLPFEDIKVADYLLHPNEARREMSDILSRYDVDVTETLEVYQITNIHNKVSELLQVGEMTDLYKQVEMPLLEVLGSMESYGVHLDPEYLLNYSQDLTGKIQQLEKIIYKHAGREFNINSTKQLASILFDELKVHELLGVKKLKKTKTGYSTDESVLISLSEHELPKAVLEYRSLNKLVNTWVDVLPQHIHQKTHRVHTRFNQTVAATGRLSSERPNLQNIPMRSKEGRLIRKAFTAGEGNVLISADYSQVEIRILAGLAKESHLIEAFKSGEDIHRATASRIFGISLEDVDSNLRSQAKAVNFGIIYGMGARRLAAQTGVSFAEAKEFIAKYFEAYSGIQKFTEGLIEKARETGFSQTLLGRKRQVKGLDDSNAAIVSRAENIAVNAPIQGSAADIIKVAMIKIDRALKKYNRDAYLILQVHDELLVECRKDLVDDVSLIIKKGMEEAVDFVVPLLVELGTGECWLEAH